MNEEVRKHINESIKSKLGITYDEFEKLNFNEQQRLIEQNRQKKKNKKDKVRTMIGSGEHTIFVTKKRGQKYMLSDGTFVMAGDTPEESRARLEKRLDDLIYSKQVAFVKKINRRLKKVRKNK